MKLSELFNPRPAPVKGVPSHVPPVLYPEFEAVRKEWDKARRCYTASQVADEAARRVDARRAEVTR